MAEHKMCEASTFQIAPLQGHRAQRRQVRHAIPRRGLKMPDLGHLRRLMVVALAAGSAVGHVVRRTLQVLGGDSQTDAVVIARRVPDVPSW
jgi:hypothetical protein